MRINKYIAHAGLCSRREADKLIKAGRVKINNRISVLGDKVGEGDSVEVDNKKIETVSKKIYIAFNKPYGVIVTSSKNADNNVMDYINIEQRIYPIGRLDVESEGLLLLTNDGEVVNKLLKSKYKKEKVYEVNLDKNINQKFINTFEKGVILDGRVTTPIKVQKISSKVVELKLVEGRNRQIRRMCEIAGYKVLKLKRISFAGVCLGDLEIGKWRYLNRNEVSNLR